MLLLVSVSAHAAGDVERAREYVARASRAYDLHDWSTSCELYKRAYEEREDPSLLFNLGQCHRQLGHYDDAAIYYRSYLSKSQDLNAPLSVDEKLVRRLIYTMDEAARHERGKMPPPGTIAGSPPTHPRHWYQNATGWSFTSAGVATVIVGGVLLVLASNAGRAAVTAPTLIEQERLLDNDVVYQQAGWSLLSVGAASVVTGVLVLSFGGRKK